jgi:D-aminopeptidase
VGGIGANSSGDIFLAFATGNRGLPAAEGSAPLIASCRMVANDRVTPLFEACAEATEEAILNAMCMATTTVGINGFTIHALPLHRVREICAT